MVNWTYLRAPWELDGPLNIGVCLEEGHNSFDDAYSTLGALKQSFWIIFVLKNLCTHFTQVLVSSKKNISIFPFIIIGKIRGSQNRNLATPKSDFGRGPAVYNGGGRL